MLDMLRVVKQTVDRSGCEVVQIRRISDFPGIRGELLRCSVSGSESATEIVQWMNGRNGETLKW